MVNLDLRRRLAVVLVLALTTLAAVAGLATAVETEPGSGTQPAVVLAVSSHAVVAHLDTPALPADVGAGVPIDGGVASPAAAVDSVRAAEAAAPRGRSPPLSR